MKNLCYYGGLVVLFFGFYLASKAYENLWMTAAAGLAIGVSYSLGYAAGRMP